MQLSIEFRKIPLEAIKNISIDNIFIKTGAFSYPEPKNNGQKDSETNNYNHNNKENNGQIKDNKTEHKSNVRKKGASVDKYKQQEQKEKIGKKYNIIC